eukprot:TRINITY_DN10927_c0_g1_i2.p1 TRINITY_DN10927_c0_g1~~TRINITY_DN10927_c0_g1_i2.p1  ORF type:complete len:364 (+),score=37.30 TRINITY_DN10927_c0_g1_i2:210-1301(+)
MALHRVEMTPDAHLVCLTHAMTTGKEEVAGLLIGLKEDSGAGKHFEFSLQQTRSNRRLSFEYSGTVAIVTDVFITVRKDRRPDRVEISAEQLSAGQIHAEHRARQAGLPLTVLGWYHSHPNLTVWPSHVDLRTQMDFQQLGADFVGLIFSVYDSKELRTDLCCFQSRRGPTGHERVDVPVLIRKDNFLGRDCLLALPALLRSLSEEEQATFDEVNRTGARKANGADTIHNNAVYNKALCDLIDKVAEPLLQLFMSASIANESPSQHTWANTLAPTSRDMTKSALAKHTQDNTLDTTLAGTPVMTHFRKGTQTLQPVMTQDEVKYSPYYPTQEDTESEAMSQGLLKDTDPLERTTMGLSETSTP